MQPSEKLAAFDKQVQGKIQEMKDCGIEVLACKWCSVRMDITQRLESQGIKVVYVIPVISQLFRTVGRNLHFNKAQLCQSITQAGFALSWVNLIFQLVGSSNLNQIEQTTACSDNGPILQSDLQDVHRVWASNFYG